MYTTTYVHIHVVVLFAIIYGNYFIWRVCILVLVRVLTPFPFGLFVRIIKLLLLFFFSLIFVVFLCVLFFNVLIIVVVLVVAVVCKFQISFLLRVGTLGHVAVVVAVASN